MADGGPTVPQPPPVVPPAHTETSDCYVTYIKQVATLLGYGKPQVQKYALNYIILGTLSLEDLRLAVETAKRILTKEKIDRKLAGQSSLTPIMSIKDGYNSKKVTFEMQDGLDDI